MPATNRFPARLIVIMSEPTRLEPQPTPPAHETASWGTGPGDGTSELARVLDQYLAELEAGRAPDRARLLAAHPHLGPQLEQALAGLEFVHQATGRTNGVPVQLGDFRIVREVGRGGMGVVYEAEQVSLRRRVALKVLRFGAVADEVAMQRFQREAETVARLHHTNIVPIFAVGSAEGVRYYAMQFIEGRDLAERLRQARETGKTLAEREIAGWGLQAAEALAHAHRRGVIHRDIKPSNLICDPDGRVWLTDFGLARRVEDAGLSLTGALLGTPRYMSPEQARAARQPVDHRTDLYSLGATLYELATLRPIFEAATAHEVIAQILHADPAPPRSLAPGLARDLETIIVKCLAKEPGERYPTAEALAEDLRAFLSGRPIAARPPNWSERAVRWARKHRRTTAVAAFSAGAATLLVVGSLLAWQQHHRARLGSLAVSTSGPNVLAEVLDPAGQPVLPVFPLPTASPVSLPAGGYQLRLSASGMLSESWPIEIRPRALEQHALQLRPRWLWPPREVNVADSPETEIVTLGPSADLLTLTHATTIAGVRRYEGALQLVRGATGEVAWERPLRFDESSLPARGNLEEWKRLFVWGIASSFQNSGLSERAQDLNGDGTRDLLLVSRNSPSMVAVSGQTGTVLWWYRLRPPVPGESAAGESRLDRPGRGCVVGLPAVADVDQDGISDFVACFWSDGDSFLTPASQSQRTEPHGWIGAVSGRTGDGLWLRPVDARWGQYANSSGERDKYDALCRPAVGRVGDRNVVLLSESTRLLGWDVANGAPAWPPFELGFAPVWAPDLRDLEGDGTAEVVVLRQPEETSDLALRALALPDGAVRWAHRVPTLAQHQIRNQSRPDRTVRPPEDLDGDGRPEIVALFAKETHPGVHVLGVELLEGATGQPRWTQRLGVSRYFGQGETVQRIVTAPDLDGDGHRELVAVWHAEALEAARRGLVVAALSGRSGAVLWRALLTGASEARTLGWWQPGTDGWPLLLVGVNHAGGGQRMTYALAGGSGQVEHVLPDVAEPQVADFNGDGLADLFYTVSPQGAPRQLVVKGTPPQPWKRPGAWQAAGDFDGDRETDLVGTENRRLTARSGRDGRVLWRNDLEVQGNDPWLAPRSRAHDLDGDGTPDLVQPASIWRQTEDRVRSSYRTLAAVSGRDGRSLWVASDWELGASGESGGRTAWSYQYPTFAWDVGAPGSPVGVLIAQRGNDRSLRLTKLAGRDGRPQWSLPMIRGGVAPFPSPSGPPLADVNEDGIRDVALWSPVGADLDGRTPCRLTLYDGKSGGTLWSSPDLALEDETRVVWPEAVVGDLDGDGHAEVVVVRHHGFDGQSPGYRCELVVVDGRSGQIRWAWSWRTGFPDIWPPLLLPLGTGGARICLAVREEGFDGLVLFEATGQLRLRRPLGLSRNSLDAGRLVWRVVEFEGPGKAALCYLDADEVRVAEGEALEVRWHWPIRGDLAMALDLLPADAGGTPTLPIWSGREVFGFNALDGTVHWRGTVSGEPRLGGSNPPEVRLVRSQAFGGLPRMQYLELGGWLGQEASALAQVWPARANDGRYAAPTAAPVAATGLSEIPLPPRPWPWADRLWLTMGFLSGAVSLLLVALPTGLAISAIRGRSWLRGILLVAYAGLSMLAFQQGAPVVPALVFCGWLLGWSWRSRTGWLAVVGVLYSVLCGLVLAAAALGHPAREAHPWGASWWLSELVGESLAVGLAGLPPLLFWRRVGLAWRGADWRTFGRWVGGALLAAAVLAAIILLFDRRQMLPEEHYSARGWYGIGFAGVYVAGCFGLLELAWQRVWRRRVGRATAEEAL